MDDLIIVIFIVIFLCYILAYTISIKNKVPVAKYGKGLNQRFAKDILDGNLTDNYTDTEISDIIIDPMHFKRFSYASINTLLKTGNRIDGYKEIKGFGPINNYNNKDICGPVWNQQNCDSCWYMATLQAVLENGVFRGSDIPPQTTNIPYAYGLGNTTLSGYWAIGRNVCDGGLPNQALAILRNIQVVPAIPEEYTLDIFPNSRLANACIDTEDCISIIPDWPGSVSTEAFNIFTDTYVTQNITDIKNGLPADGTIQITNTDVTNVKIQKLLQKLGPAVITVDSSKWNLVTQVGENVAYQPLSFSRPVNGKPDHAIQLVGWKIRQNKLYWQVRNQWSDEWGFYGYIFIEAGTYILDCFYSVMFFKDNYIDLGGYNSPDGGTGIAGNSIGESPKTPEF